MVECSPAAGHGGPGFLESHELQIFTSVVLKVWSLDLHDRPRKLLEIQILGHHSPPQPPPPELESLREGPKQWLLFNKPIRILMLAEV